MAFYDPRVFELHVLLVDHDFDALVQTATAIQSISYGGKFLINYSVCGSSFTLNEKLLTACKIHEKILINNFALINHN